MENTHENVTPPVEVSAFAPAPQPAAQPRPVPYWHTALLLAVLAGMSLLNTKTGHGRGSGNGHVRIYLATMAYEWVLVGYIWWGVRRVGGSLRELIGGRWQKVEDFLLDIGIAFGGWIATLIVLACIAVALGMDHPGNLGETQKQIGFLAPQSAFDVVLWLGLSATAGFCEEVMFRGYMQRQFTRLLRNRWLALAVVSIFFGLGHGYEGPQRMVLIGVLGFGLGTMSLLRKSLRPAMIAHTAQDVISGLLLRALR
ncbi:MAG: CPBP family intramembrane metalloprotease [Acidobacteriota bacterium]|nr:CPBP family intramembrane metalloprotease [Acidobacteriota bacterium]